MSDQGISRGAVLRALLGAAGLGATLAAAWAMIPALGTVADQGYWGQGLRRLAITTLASETGQRLGDVLPMAGAAAAALLLLPAAWARLRPGSRAPGRWLRMLGGAAAWGPGALAVLVLAGPALFAWHHREMRRPAGPNVILIVIDTLRADHLGAYGHDAGSTPNLDRLASESVLFRNVYSPSSWTRPAIASILTGVGPLDHGITSESAAHALAPRFVTLAEYLEDRGYRTQAVVTNPHYRFGMQQSFGGVRYIGNGWAENTYRRAVEYVQQHREDRFFLLVHNNNPHDAYEYHPGFSLHAEASPYRQVSDLLPAARSGGPEFESEENRQGRVLLDDDGLAEMRDNYDGEIAYLDHHLGGFLDLLRETGLDRETLVILTADHGEEFLDHGSYWHGGTLYDELLRVPLLVRAPGLESGERHQRVSTLDLFPTVVDLLGDSLPAASLRGVSLAPLLAGGSRGPEPILSATAFRGRLKYSLIAGDDKLIRFADGEVIGLFDLAQDPAERDDLSAREPDRLARMERLLNGALQEAGGAPPPAGKTEIDEETRRELRALGYAG